MALNSLAAPNPYETFNPEVGSQGEYKEEFEAEHIQAEKIRQDLVATKKTFKTIPEQFKQSVFELAGDLDKHEFKTLVKPYLGIETEGERLIDLRDSNDRTLVNQAAFKGNFQVLKYLLAIHKEKRVTAYSEDVNGNNALELACIRGYNNTPKERHIYPPEKKSKTS